MGNHDLLALDILTKLSVIITEDNYNAYLTNDIMLELMDWIADGGETTFSQFCELNKEQRQDILEYLSEFSLYEVIDISEKSFILSHAGLGNFRKDKKLREYTWEELLFGRNNPDLQYIDDENIYLVREKRLQRYSFEVGKRLFTYKEKML